MSGPASADHILQTRGVSRDVSAFVVGAAFARDGATAAFALGDGTVRLAPTGGGADAAWTEVPAHDGGTLALAVDPAGGFLTGGDDGRLVRISQAGEASELARFGSKWVEHVAAFAEDRGGVLACTVGRQVRLLDGAGAVLKTLEHPSTVTGVAFDARGKRVVASHYGGASLWYVASKTDNPRRLEWKGSHTGIAISPDGDAIVTSMQENSLHGWRLSDGQHMRMTGYPAKTRAMSFTRSGKWLATSGAESIVLWPFFGGGPTGKAPMELAGGDTVICTFVAAHPQREMIAAGFSDGLVILAEIADQRLLPVAGPGRGPISALAWSPDGSRLALGTETGFAAVVDFTARR